MTGSRRRDSETGVSSGGAVGPAFQTAAGRRRLHTLTEQKKKEMAERERESEARTTVVGCLTVNHLEPHIEKGEKVVGYLTVTSMPVETVVGCMTVASMHNEGGAKATTGTTQTTWQPRRSSRLKQSGNSG